MVTKNEKDHYSVKWPWRAQIPNLSDNFGFSNDGSSKLLEEPMK
ncbi:unnamed protein product [Enterobius vermicularis]|uniref:Uncharacterized protein n=1 Tax=Enterobius vermicularis TaxID=51028 RepID=A0A0N4VE01_ENTVE|nr:unnamed protein product [Enterobius vermicularis]